VQWPCGVSLTRASASASSLTVRDNKPAVLHIGDQVPITTQSATSVLTIGAPIVNSVSYKDTGVILSITPRINESGPVLLDVEQEVLSVAQTTSSNIDAPTIRQRKIKTSVVLNEWRRVGAGRTLWGSLRRPWPSRFSSKRERISFWGAGKIGCAVFVG
jgi:type II secretory pathway component HofQ